jgi:hypothetical protein
VPAAGVVVAAPEGLVAVDLVAKFIIVDVLLFQIAAVHLCT